MLDVAIAPLLWRLDHYGIDLGKQAAPLMKYAERIFSRQGFIDALTPPKGHASLTCTRWIRAAACGPAPGTSLNDTPLYKPYLIRAIYEWCSDNGFTPYLAVKGGAGYACPDGVRQDGQIVLNVSADATNRLMRQ